MVKDAASLLLRFRRLRGLVALLACWAGVARGAVISEVFLAGLPGSPVPDAVELDGLAAVGRPAVDLVVLDASVSFGPIIWQVVTVPTTSNTLLISDDVWPTLLWGSAGAPQQRATLAQIGAASAEWKLGGSRTLVLFDRTTNLVANLQTLSSQLHLLNGAQPLDWLTFRRGAAPIAAWAGETIADTALGYAISRPTTAAGSWGPALVGSADAAGYLIGANQAYQLTPGWQNSPTGPATPEPGAAGAIAAFALFYAVRRPIMGGHARRTVHHRALASRPRRGRHRTHPTRRAG